MRISTASGIHPRACTCRFCVELKSRIPLQDATAEDIAAVLLDEIRNETGEEITVQIRYAIPTEQSLLRAVPVEVIATCGDLSWPIDTGVPARAALMGRW